MRQLLLFLFLFYASSSMAQIDLTVLPKEERDSALVAIVQNLLLRKFPDKYREEVYPIIWEGVVDKSIDWGVNGKKQYEKHYKYPDYVKSGDVYYHVDLYYKHWLEEDLGTYEIASATIIGKTGEIKGIYLYHTETERIFHWWGDLPDIPDVPSDQRRLSALSRAERDSILNVIAQKAFKEKYPDSYREHLSPCITTHDFSILRLKWVQQDESVPDYVNPEDTYYIVNLYYKDWQKERDIFPAPFIGSVYIVEKTREVYKVTEKRNHKLPISGDE